MPRLVLGVDLGGSNVRALLADRSGAALAERADATVGGDARAVVAQLVDISRGLADDARLSWEEVVGGAVGVPGVADVGGLRLAPNLPPFDGVDLAAALRAELGIPVEVENDANVAALAEARRGAGVGRSHFVFVIVGTGIGMGIVAGGRLVRGATGAAGEVGALPVGPEQLELEALASGAGIARRYAGRTGRRLSAAEIYDTAAAGDDAAAAVVDEQAHALALAAVSVQHLLDPELIVLGGGIGSRADVVERVRTHARRLGDAAPVVVATALGEWAGAVGAAELALGETGKDSADA